MKRLATRMSRFIKDEDGMEFIQVAVLVVAIAVLSAALYALYQVVAGKIETAGNNLDLSK